MPVLLVCPGCGANMNAPDGAAGRKVRCPRPDCRAVTTVPGPPAVTGEVVDDEEDDRPRGGRRRDDEDDDRPRSRRRRDDEDDEDDRPRRKRRRAGSGGKAGVVIAVVVGLVVVLGGVGFAVYRLAGGGKASVPAGWTAYTAAEDGFRAYFPKDVVRSGGGGSFDVAGGGMRLNTTYTSGGPTDPLRVEVVVIRLPASTAREYREKMARARGELEGFAAAKGGEVRTVRWLGVDATEVLTPQEASRVAITSTAIYRATVTGVNGGRARPEEEAGFFDNFTLK